VKSDQKLGTGLAEKTVEITQQVNPDSECENRSGCADEPAMGNANQSDFTAANDKGRGKNH
jgi:hypothetical protein